jgi:hypothetical protein
MASAHEQSQTGRAALAALYQIHWYPLWAFARRCALERWDRHSQDDASSMTGGSLDI